MTQQEMIDACLKYTLYSWSATGRVSPLPIERAKGIYLYGPNGQRWMDFNSQLMSVNIGHSHPKVIQAIKDQADTLIYTIPGSATKARAELGKRLAEIVPGNINTFFFTLSGAESNENAIKAVRQYSGRFKILSNYRSYHGATSACLALTGDPRRNHNMGPPGFVQVMGPWPYTYSWGETDEEITRKHLVYLEEIINFEGPDAIAAMFIESITGTNGILPPPKGYLKGLRALLDKYGILLVCDEVMSGWGRTGKLFAFEHGDIVPDIVTMAKGLTSSYIPLGAVGMSDPIAKFFQDNVFRGGLTYNAHALCLGTALAAINVLMEEELIENAAAMGKVMRSEFDRLAAKHPSVKGGRCIGLFGMVDIQINSAGDSIAPFNTDHPAMAAFARRLLENGLFTFIKWGSFMCNPPLCITKEQLLEGFAIIDDALELLDAEFEGGNP